MKTKSQDFLVARPICSAISSNFCGLAATAQSPFLRQYCNCLARSLVAAFLAFGSAISVALLTRQEQKAKRRRKEGALRRKRVIICRPPAAAAAAAGGAACQNSRSSDVLFRARTPRFSHMVIYCSSAPHSRRLTRDGRGRCPCLSCPSRRHPYLHSVHVRPQCLPTATDRRSPSSRTSVPLPTTNDFPIQKTPVIPRGSIKRKSCPRAGDIFAPSPGEGAGCRSV